MCIKNNKATVESFCQEIRIILVNICNFTENPRIGVLNRLKPIKKLGNKQVYEFGNSNDQLSIAFAEINTPNNLRGQAALLETKARQFQRSFKECDETKTTGEQCYSDSVSGKIEQFLRFADYVSFDVVNSPLFAAYFGGRIFNLSLGISLGFGGLSSGLAIPVGKSDVGIIKQFVNGFDRECNEVIALTYQIVEDTISCSEKDNDKLPDPENPDPDPPPPTSDVCIDISNSLKAISEKTFNIESVNCDLQPVLDKLTQVEINILNAIDGLDLSCPEPNLQPVIDAIQNSQDYLDNRIISLETILNIISDLSARIKADTQGIYNDTQYLRTCPCNDDVVDRLTDIINNLEQTEIDLDELKVHVTNEHEETRNTLNPEISGEISIDGCPDTEIIEDAYFNGLAEAWATSLIGKDKTSITAFLQDRLKFAFSRVFNEFDGFNASFQGRGLLGISNQIAALSKQAATINEQLCLDPEKLQIPQALPSNECEVIVVEPFEKYAEFQRITQLAITYIPLGESRTRQTSRWSLNIPNPIDIIDWCRDIEPLVWHKGSVSLRIFWDNSKVWTGGYFMSEAVIDAIIPKIVRLSNSTPTNIRISKGGSPKRNYKDITVVPVVASVVSYDNDSNKTGIVCYKRPPGGC